MQTNVLRKRLDTFGIIFSLACTVHCVVLPVVAIMLPAFGALLLTDEWFHSLIALLVVPSSIIAIYIGYSTHRDRGTSLLALTGLAFILAGLTVAHDLGGELIECCVTTTGSILLATGHGRNYHLCRQFNGHNLDLERENET
jgi:uncharacterized membrane protein HdeD (DUF308 family)